jgi:hypothetical protein
MRFNHAGDEEHRYIHPYSVYYEKQNMIRRQQPWPCVSRRATKEAYIVVRPCPALDATLGRTHIFVKEDDDGFLRTVIMRSTLSAHLV